MAQEGTSLAAVASNGTFTGAAVTPTNPFANSSMVVTVANYAGTGDIVVALQISHDGTNWVTPVSVTYQSGPTFVNVIGFPGIQLRAVILSWPSSVTGGTLTATVAGV